MSLTLMHIPTVFPIHHVIWGRFSGWLAPEPAHILRAHYVFIRIWYDPFQCWFDFTCLGHLIVGYSGEGVYCYAAWAVSSHWLLLLARQFFFFGQTTMFLHTKRWFLFANILFCIFENSLNPCSCSIFKAEMSNTVSLGNNITLHL